MPISAFANTTTGHIYNVKFEDIEEEIAVRNPLVKITNKGIEDSISASTQLSNLKGSLNTTKTALESERDGLIAELGGIPADINNPTIDLTGLTREQADAALITYINKIRLNYTLFRLVDINTQIAGITDINTGDLQLQKELVLRQQSYITQNLVIALHESLLNQKELNNQLNLLKIQQAVMGLQEKLGMITNISTKSFEIELRNLENLTRTMENAKQTIQGEINLMFGQEFDISLQIGDLPILDQESIMGRNVNHDFEIALATNYSLRQKKIGTTEYESEVRKIRSAFYSVSNEVNSKLESIQLEKLKINNEKVIISHMNLKYKLGLISKVQYENAQTKYASQEKSLKEAEYDLFKSYSKYSWMKRGLNTGPM